MKNTHDVGLFQIGASLASCVGMITGAFQMAWGPFAYSIHKEVNAKKVFADAFQIYTAAVCGIALAVALFAEEILYIFTTEKYIGAFVVAGILSYNYYIIGLTYLASIGTSIAKNNKAFGISMVISAIVLVLLNFLLVPSFGKEGAAASITLSQMIVPVSVFWHAQKLYPISYNFKKALALFLSSGFLAVSCLVLTSYFSISNLLEFVVKAIAVVLYSILVFFMLVKELKRSSPLQTPTLRTI
jgi:O-antigen/teichoic acid export membrane protein